MSKNLNTFLLKEGILNEGINDKYLFKAVFLAGGPGSGKSFISDLMFKGEPVVFINSDSFLEFYLNKKNLPKVFDISNAEVYAKQSAVRQLSKKVTTNKLINVVNGMLPIIVDGTGKDYKKITSLSNDLRSVGYDTHMVFINTSLEVAKQRNLMRDRVVPEQVLVDSWYQVQGNIGTFQSYFGNKNFKIVDNNKVLDKDAINELKVKLVKQSRKFLTAPIQNNIGKNTIDRMRQSKAKLLSDIDVNFSPSGKV